MLEEQPAVGVASAVLAFTSTRLTEEVDVYPDRTRRKRTDIMWTPGLAEDLCRFRASHIHS